RGLGFLMLAAPVVGDQADAPLPISVRSSLPGRIRLDVPAMLSNAPLAAALEDSLRNLPGVTRVRVNSLTASVLAIFDTDKDPAEFLAQVGARLRNDVHATQPQTQSRHALRRVLALAVPKGARNRVVPALLTTTTTATSVLQLQAFSGFISI